MVGENSSRLSDLVVTLDFWSLELIFTHTLVLETEKNIARGETSQAITPFHFFIIRIR